MVKQLSLLGMGEVDVAKYLAHVLYVSSCTDWVTRAMVKNAAPWMRSSSEIAFQRYKMEPPPQDKLDKARRMVEWGQKYLTREFLSPYEKSIGQLLICERVHRGEIGLLASFVPYYSVARWAVLSSEAYGIIDNRYDLGPLFLVSSISVSSEWGSVNKYTLLDLNQRVFVWQTGVSLKDSAMLSGRGTVKRFKDVCNGIVTILTRCRFNEIKDSHLTTVDEFSKIWMIGDEGEWGIKELGE
jgi:hypothetical protein